MQSSYSRLCGGYRRLPTDRREVGKCRFILVESFRNYLDSDVQIDAAEEMPDFGDSVVSRWGQHRFQFVKGHFKVLC